MYFYELPHGFLPKFVDGKPTLECQTCDKRWDDKLHQESEYNTVECQTA